MFLYDDLKNFMPAQKVFFVALIKKIYSLNRVSIPHNRLKKPALE